MTETCMILGNSYDQNKRYPGYVGLPFNSVNVRLDPETNELQVKGPTLFKEYYNKPNETKKEFTDDSWFKTGDIAEFDEELQIYKISGRASSDIIKSNAYKISALDIETKILENNNVKEICIFGIPDEVKGEKIAGLIVLKDNFKLNNDLELNNKNITTYIKEFLKDKIAPYQIPEELKIINDEIEKNHMGKINKKQVKKEYF